MTSMDEATRKVLRRACARFNTGIRTPFKLGDFWARIEPEKWDATDPDDPIKSGEVMLVLQRDSLHNVHIGLVDATPEAVWQAYLQSQVELVHAL